VKQIDANCDESYYNRRLQRTARSNFNALSVMQIIGIRINGLRHE